METPKKFGALTSSVDPNRLSLTVESSAKVLIGLLAWWAARKGVSVEQTTDIAQNIVDITVVAIPAGFTVFQALHAVYGFARKIFVLFSTARDPMAGVDENTAADML